MTALSLALPAARRIRPGVVIAAALVLFLAVAALAPGLLTSQDPLRIDLSAVLRPPSAGHWFGTDQSGRDVYARIVYGARQSLFIGLGATAIGMSAAVLLGVLAGLGGRWIDAVVNRIVEVLFSFPALLLALLFVTVFGAGALTQAVAVGVGTAPGYARMIRGQVIAVRDSGYVEAAHALGHPYGRVLRRHILPNAMRPLVALVTLGVGQSIVWASGLAFLGLGVAPPSPEWGALLDAGRNYITRAWWLEVMPGLTIVAIALAVTALGRYVSERLEGGSAR
ncbi:MAG: peptide/nickel transport system permease protein [Cryptosporangiaceae bacterium]|nr:peptide/nickel transport system permease protein [Cryptosporangiaceae bacterium]